MLVSHPGTMVWWKRLGVETDQEWKQELRGCNSARAQGNPEPQKQRGGGKVPVKSSRGNLCFLFPHFISTIFSLPLNNFQPYDKCNVLNECKRYSGILDQKSPNRPEAYAPLCSPHTHTHRHTESSSPEDCVKTPSCCAEGKVTHEAKLCWQFLIPAHQGFKLYNKEMTCWITSRVCLKI